MRASDCPRGSGSEERIGFFCSVCVDWYESLPFLVMLCNHTRRSRVSRVCGCSELCLLGDCSARFVFFFSTGRPSQAFITLQKLASFGIFPCCTVNTTGVHHAFAGEQDHRILCTNAVLCCVCMSV